ncbi:MAG: NADH-ubiquinone oxidoreductase-F iron-sulfur binding region domain-containing protein, partial [Oscillospiraceae bacterium]|nr:NADH-ubiquinone oxidoreductase-F iron-sulfur binding region domain-containing protein [Oscillospiraceae bacterium]
MSRLQLPSLTDAEKAAASLNAGLAKRVVAAPTGNCPVEMTLDFVRTCHSQSCGKCVPCRIGLKQLENMLEDVLNGHAEDGQILPRIKSLATTIYESADCAIGFEAAQTVLRIIDGFHADFQSHLESHRCDTKFSPAIPCVSTCPAHVDVPGYIALVGAGRFQDAVRLIRRDNPFATTCAYICEHPCETMCRRNYLESPVNIRGLKKYAVDHAGVVPVPTCAASTGKRIAIVGGGPCGLTAAYFLQLMGHQTVVYEKHEQLGGMLRYGIPNYRLSRERLHDDIDAIVSSGVEVRLNRKIG